MSIPGFTAHDSLYPSEGHYATALCSAWSSPDVALPAAGGGPGPCIVACGPCNSNCTKNCFSSCNPGHGWSQSCCVGAQRCCGGTCVQCPAGGVCSGASCVCPPWLTNCGGACVECPQGGVCLDGTRCDCPNGLTDCGNQCVQCPVGGVCLDGTRCDCLSGTNCGGTCVQCPAGGVCSGTSCVCPSGLTNCGGACIPTTGDVSNCGGCGQVCPPNQACVNGQCAGPDCGNCQVCDLDSGQCGLACSDPCTARSLRTQASADADYQLLLGYLSSQGFTHDYDQAILLQQGGAPFGSAFAAHFSSGPQGYEAQLAYGVDSTSGRSSATALLSQQSIPQFTLFIDGSGQVAEIVVPPLSTWLDMAASGAAGASTLGASIASPRPTPFDPSDWCPLCQPLCQIMYVTSLAGAGFAAGAIIGAGACAPTVVGIPWCAGLVATALAGVIGEIGDLTKRQVCQQLCSVICQCGFIGEYCYGKCCYFSQNETCSNGVCTQACTDPCTYYDPLRKGCYDIKLNDPCMTCNNGIWTRPHSSYNSCGSDCCDGPCAVGGQGCCSTSSTCGSQCCDTGETCCNGACRICDP